MPFDRSFYRAAGRGDLCSVGEGYDPAAVRQAASPQAPIPDLFPSSRRRHPVVLREHNRDLAPLHPRAGR